MGTASLIKASTMYLKENKLSSRYIWNGEARSRNVFHSTFKMCPLIS